MTENSWGPFKVKFIRIMKQLCEKINSFVVIPSKNAKLRYHFFHSCLFTFHSLIQLLLPKAKLNGVDHQISVEYKTVYGLNQAVFRT